MQTDSILSRKKSAVLVIVITLVVFNGNLLLLSALKLFTLILAIGWGILVNWLMRLNDRNQLKFKVAFSRPKKAAMHALCLAFLLLSFFLIDYLKHQNGGELILQADRGLVINEIIIIYATGVLISYVFPARLHEPSEEEG